MRWILVTAWCALVAIGCGWGGSPAERTTFSCDRGFREFDWHRKQLKTAQSIAKCNWLKGWTESQVRRALGTPEDGIGATSLTWGAGGSTAGIGPEGWFLSVELNGDHYHPIVVRARTYLAPT